MFISAFRKLQCLCLTIGYNRTRHNSQSHLVLSKLLLWTLSSGLFLALPAILGLTLNPQMGSVLTPDSNFSVSLPSSSLLSDGLCSAGERVLCTAYINWDLDNFWVHLWIMICKLPGWPNFNAHRRSSFCNRY